MAAETITDASVTIGGVDLSSLIKAVTVNKTFDPKETTGFGATVKTREAGLGDVEISIDWFGDYAASSVYATMEPLIGTVTTYAVKKSSGATAATNPQWSGNVLVTEFPLIAAEHGEVHEFSTTWPGDGDYTEATA